MNISDDNDNNDYRANICGNDLYQEPYMQVIWILYEIITILAVVCIAYIWLKNRQTFPLMERSPYLSIYFLLNVMIYQLSYPIFLQIDYFQRNEDSLLLKCIFLPFQGSYTYLYLVKSVRLAWGFNINKKGCLKRFQNYLNYIFARESILILICIVLLGFQLGTGIIPSSEYNQFDFMAINIENKDIYILLTRMIENYVGLFYLFLSLLLVRRVDRRVSIIYELYVIIICDIIAASLRHILMVTNLEVASNLCINGAIPMLYLINWIKLTTTICVGMVRPLKMINKEHQYYNSIVARDLKSFLYYQSDIFNKFLDFCTQQSSTHFNKSHLFVLTPCNSSNVQRCSTSSPLFPSPNHQFQTLNNEINTNANPPLLLQRDSNNPTPSHNQNSYESSLSNTQGALQGSREVFLRKFKIEFVKGHFNLYLKAIISNNNSDCKQFEEEFKQYLEDLHNNGQLEKLFPQQTEILNQIRHWLKIDSFLSAINKIDNESQNYLSSSNIGVLGTLYQNKISSDSSQLEEYFQRRNLEPSQIIVNILQYSQEQLQPCYNEYKMTKSFQQIEQNLKDQLQVYTNLLQINMAIDPNINVT